MSNPEDYFSKHGVVPKVPAGNVAAVSVSVLGCLHGRRWDEISLAIVSALDPSAIRVIKDGMLTADSWLYRVTVMLDEEQIIQSVTQELPVILPLGIQQGIGLLIAYKFGVDSIEFKNHMSRGGSTAAVSEWVIG